MGLFISVKIKKHIEKLPKCEFEYEDVEERELRGRKYQSVVFAIGYTDEDYAKYKHLNAEQAIRLVNLLHDMNEFDEDYNADQIIKSVSAAIILGYDVFFEADW